MEALRKDLCLLEQHSAVIRMKDPSVLHGFTVHLKLCLFFRYASELDKRVQKLDTNGGCRVKSLVIKACHKASSYVIAEPLTICQDKHHPVALTANEVNVQSQATDCVVALSPNNSRALLKLHM